MTVTISEAGSREKSVLDNLMQLYLHDLSEYFGSGPGAAGLFDLGAYELYWIDSAHQAFLIRTGGHLAGFAFVHETSTGAYTMAEFFILRAFRRSGLGTRAARALFDRFHGERTVAELESNLPAQRFWRRVISDYTSGRFNEAWSEARPRGPKQRFNN